MLVKFVANGFFSKNLPTEWRYQQTQSQGLLRQVQSSSRNKSKKYKKMKFNNNGNKL